MLLVCYEHLKIGGTECRFFTADDFVAQTICEAYMKNGKKLSNFKPG